jgi:hypothetical protein
LLSVLRTIKPLAAEIHDTVPRVQPHPPHPQNVGGLETGFRV